MAKTTSISSFGQWVKPLQALNIQHIVDQYQGDRYVKKLNVRSFVYLLLHAHLDQKRALRELETAVRNNESLQAELGLDSISFSQISRTCQRLDPEIFKTMFVGLLSEVQWTVSSVKPLLPVLGIAKIVDSTTIPLCLAKYQWAKFRKTKAGVKVHTRVTFVDPEHVYPDKASITPARIHERKKLVDMIDDKDALYVFHRGYLDYKEFDRLCDDGVSCATRLKGNAVYKLVYEGLVDEETAIERDARVILGSGPNRMRHALRIIETLDSQGNRIIILTNQFKVLAEEVAVRNCIGTAGKLSFSFGG